LQKNLNGKGAPSIEEALLAGFYLVPSTVLETNFVEFDRQEKFPEVIQFGTVGSNMLDGLAVFW
jgi:hypothetical protein